ncbi:MAG: succinate--CoA ligase subunit beta [Firmicutes bacterium]|nr:succinate--CoA ligase subunit beta [Bacillota bacterium]
MKLFEFQAKRIFAQYGLPVPESDLLLSSQDLPELPFPLILKAQVLTGGRGKAGGIKICSDKKELGSLLTELFNMRIKGEPVRAVLAEEKAKINQEFYLSITLQGSKARPLIIASPAGGMDIEQVAAKTPEKIIKIPIDPLIGPQDYQIRYLAKRMGYQNKTELKNFVANLYQAFCELDATLLEINPLASTDKGLVALDGKVTLDDKANFRQEALFKELLAEQQDLPGADPASAHMSEDTITYVPLTGTVGLISDGAGTGMLTLDLIKDAGGEAANFCEMGGLTSPEIMYKAMETVLSDPNVKSLLVVLIGGFNRMDEMAEGIVKYKKVHGLNIPVIVRMCGTMEEEGKELMAQAGIPTYDDLLEAVGAAVKGAEGEADGNSN